MKAQLRNAFLFILLVFCAACSKSPQDTILGRWQLVEEQKGQENSTLWEFFNDGTFNVEDSIIPMRGKYLFLKDGRIKMETDFGGISSIDALRIEIKKDQLKLTDRKGNVMEFLRIDR